MNELKDDLKRYLKQAGAYDVRVANPSNGFEHAQSGRHPLDLWKDCRSVVVFAVAMSTAAKFTYVGTYSPSNDSVTMRFGHSSEYGLERLAHLFIATISFWGAAFLQERGYQISLSNSGLPGMLASPAIQCKLSAYEAGLGVYGRSGLILHPKLGNRLSIAVIMTDAPLDLDPKLTDYNPCSGCYECINACSADAFDPSQNSSIQSPGKYS